ncbi:MAG: CU044_2847 family protein [Cyanobacteria bacterium P01_A01_bin.84]
MDSCTENIPVQLDNDVNIMIEATLLGGEEEVDFDFLPFEQVTNAVEVIANSMTQTIKKVQPSKASIELGLEVGLKEGKLVTLIVQNSAKANFKITLEWSK